MFFRIFLIPPLYLFSITETHRQRITYRRIMSQGYAVDFYGVATYGFSQPLDYSVEPFNATQNGYNSLTLSWKSPNATPWKLMQLTSSLYGYPSSPADGTLRQSFTPAFTVTSFDDLRLLPGRIYYYTMFIALESPTWNSGTTY